jgi:hypothetical protein
VHIEKTSPSPSFSLSLLCFHLPSPLSSYLYKPTLLWDSSWCLCRTSFS